MAVFERVAPLSWVRKYWKIVNPLFLSVAGVAPGMAIIETIGRRTGRAHRIPVTIRNDDSKLWAVAAHASQSDYVRNIMATPQVRIRMLRRWRTGTAHVLENDDATRRAMWINPLNGLFVRIASSHLVTIRIDLDDNHDLPSG